MAEAYTEAQPYFRFMTMYHRSRENTWKVFLENLTRDRTVPHPVVKAASRRLTQMETKDNLNDTS